MKAFMLLFSFLLALLAQAWSVPPVLNYAGQVAVNGEAFDGNGLFKFALVNADGTTTYWSNDGTSVDGSEPQASVAVPVNGGLYSILLGNTAQQGMGAIDPAVFAQYTDAKLRVWFSDGVNGFQQLSPDRSFASVPYAFSAGTAQTAGSAPIANGAVNLDMLSQDVKDQINAPISRSRLSQEVVVDINATIGMNRLSTEVTEKLNQEKTTTNYNAPSVGSLLAVPYGSNAPAGYSLYQRGEPKELVWEEKAPVSVARYAFDGVEVLNGKIYFVGGYNGTAKNIAERYDPTTDAWEALAPMSVARRGVACSVLNGKLYAIGGSFTNSIEIYNPTTGLWTQGVPLPYNLTHGSAVNFNNKIYVGGGRKAENTSNQNILCFDPQINEWSIVATDPCSGGDGTKLIPCNEKLLLVGGWHSPEKVRSYDFITKTWQIWIDIKNIHKWPVVWNYRDIIHVAGGAEIWNNSIDSVILDSNISFTSNSQLPQKLGVADSVVLGNFLYLLGGNIENWNSYSNKVFAADMNASVDGIYDLYRKDGDAPVGTPVVQSEYADGSVTGSKMADGAITIDKLNEQILKYLKPEITSQPQAQTVYADTNVSFSVSAEGKYLTYQWKKDGVDLTGETNSTLTITDANATLHDGNYSVVVSNDFGSVESEEILVDVNESFLNGLVGWWKFDEGSGTVAYDSSGNGNDGNLTNGPTWTDGRIGGALSFDGVDDYVGFGVKDTFNLGSSISVSVWINPRDYKYAQIISKGPPSSASGSYTWAFKWRVSTDFLYFAIYGNDSLQNSLKFQQNPVLGEWSNILFSYDGANSSLYLNADKKNSMNFNTNFSNQTHALNVGSSSTTEFFNGLIDDVRIYDRALSAEEVQALYNLGQ